jgi:RNA recognition motif-containing protein
MPLSIYIGNLSLETSGPELEAAFASYGKVTCARIAMDSSTGRPRGFGFVEMSDRLEAEAAIAGLNGTQLRGKRLTVNKSEPLDERSLARWPMGPRGGGEAGARRW